MRSFSECGLFYSVLTYVDLRKLLVCFHCYVTVVLKWSWFSETLSGLWGQNCCVLPAS